LTLSPKSKSYQYDVQSLTLTEHTGGGYRAGDKLHGLSKLFDHFLQGHGPLPLEADQRPDISGQQLRNRRSGKRQPGGGSRGCQ
jgi:hypothetical protein